MTTEVSPPSSPPAIQTTQGGSSNEYETPAAAAAADEPPPLLPDRFPNYDPVRHDYRGAISMKGVDGTHPPVGPRTTTSFPAVNVGGDDEEYVHVIAATLKEEIDNMRRFAQGRDKDDSDFKPAIVAINNVIVAIDGPTNKQACEDFVDGLAHCRNKPNHMFASLQKECVDFFHNYSGDEQKAKDCGERLTVLLRLTIGTDKPARNYKQALLLMDALKHVDPFGILQTTADADHSNFLVYGASNLFLTLTNLIDTNVPELRQVTVTPNGEDPYMLDPEPLLVSTLRMVRKMVFTMTINGKYLWMKRKELGGVGGFDFLRDTLFDKYIPYSNIEDTTKTGQTAMLNRELAHCVMDIQCAMLNRSHDNNYT